MTHAKAPKSLLRAVLATALGLAVTLPALGDDAADAAPRPDPTVARIMVQLDHAQKQLGKLKKSRTTSNRIKTLDRALHFLRSARGVAVKREGPIFDALLEDIDPLLVRALNDKTRLYLTRTSYSKAIKSNEEALEIDDRNDDALDLNDRIVEQTTIDYSDDDYIGSLAYDRIHRRRDLLIGLSIQHSPRYGARSCVDGRYGRTRFRVGNVGGVAFRRDGGTANTDPHVARNAPGRSPQNPGFGFDDAPTRTNTRVGAAAGRLGSMSFGVFPRVQRNSGVGANGRAVHPSEPGAAPRIGRGTSPTTRVGGAAGRIGTTTFGVFRAVQNRGGQFVGHSSGFVRAPSPRTNAADRFSPGTISR